MKCKLCESNKVKITYAGKIRDGKVGNYFKEEVNMYKCEECGTIWHIDLEEDYKEYYESKEYREKLEGTSNIDDFYSAHDSESMEKFRYTGTEIFRNKVVADIGCGGGAFLDYINTVAKEVIAIEPSSAYREEMQKKGFLTFGYAKDAIEKYEGKVDVIVSFDVIEHVQDPKEFVKEIWKLLNEGGKAIIGTPTDAPVMRELLESDYESFLFSTQHPWVLCEGSFKVIADSCGIHSYECKYYQRYGLGNFIYWMKNKCPGRHKEYDFISKGLDELWKANLEEKKLSDYIVFEFVKSAL